MMCATLMTVLSVDRNSMLLNYISYDVKQYHDSIVRLRMVYFQVCKYFLCGFCPHELFTNTRADLGKS